MNGVYSGNLCERSLQREPMRTEFTVGTYVNGVYSGNLCKRRPCMHNVLPVNINYNCLWRKETVFGEKKVFVEEKKLFVEKKNCLEEKNCVFWQKF